MVSILPAERGPWDLIGKYIGQNVSQNLPGAVQQGYNRGMLQNSLEEIKKLANNPNSSPLDIQLAAMKAGAGIPGSERYLGQILPYLTKAAESHRMQSTPLAGEQEGIGPIPQRQPLPNFMNQQSINEDSQFFPTNIGPQGAPGQAPQAATTGMKQPLLTRAELIPRAKDLAAERTAAGIPTTPKEALEELQEAEKDKKAYNKLVDEELAQRVEAQKTYGDRAVDRLKEVYPDASPEVQAIFQKKGEDVAKEGKSEAEINRYLAKEAERFKNAISNVESSFDAPRTHNIIQRALSGNYKNFDQSAEDARRHLEPLIELGLFDTARNILAKKGYGPEERDIIVHPLSNEAKSIINQIPKFNQRVKGRITTEANKEDLKPYILSLKEKDPNFSVVLARKAFEDRNYDWRSFKDAFNDLVKEGMPLTDDQKNQMGYLDSAPLSFLGNILQGLNLIGR